MKKPITRPKSVATILLFLISFCFAGPLMGQLLKGRVLDENTKEPIPYATIQFASDKGTISNEEGFFSLERDGTADSLQIASMGYASKALPLSAINTGELIVYLRENVIALNNVYVTNKQPSAAEIMRKVLERLSNNYKDMGMAHQFFYRNSIKNVTKELDVDVKKNSGFTKAQKAKLNQSIADLKIKIHPLYVDVLGDFYKNEKSETKLDITKATRLSKPKDQEGILPPDVLELVKAVFKDSTKTYKVKSGWFKLEDSLAMKELVEKKDARTNTLDVGNYKSNINDVVRNHGFDQEHSRMQFVLEQELYEYTLEDTFDGPEGPIYKISFSPRKRAASYSGTLYVDGNDYALIKSQFEYAEGKRGEHLNLKLLLGFKFAETVWKSTLIYSKQSNGYYAPLYMVQEKVTEFYVNRPLKLVENRTKDKLELNIKTTQLIADKQELLFLGSKDISATEYNAITEKKEWPLEQLERYDASVWKAYPIMEPLEEMKRFKMAGENE
ncbi:MAG: carboxypeptidase-like regulatory domain-containing protein [Sediminicola sp.]